MKCYILILFSLLINETTISQVRFAQFYSSPLMINPANTGRFNKSYRIGGSYRREVNAQERIFTQNAIFFESKILNKVAPENDCFAIGVSGLSEVSQTEGIKNTYLSVSLAYQKALDVEGKQQLGIGFQTTFARRRLQKPTLVFEDQLLSWINSGYTVNIFQLNDVDFTYADLNAGLIYQGRINSNNYFTTGVSMYHITKPNRVFPGGEFNLPRQVWSHFGWEKKFSDEKKLYAAFLMSYSNKSVMDLFGGLNCQFKLNRFNQFLLGAWLRNTFIRGSSIIPTAGLNFGGFTLNTSYDINITTKNTNQKGALEISLIYRGANTRERFLEDKFVTF
jgi:type IX secretion system PorP/SprF family membrane protein